MFILDFEISVSSLLTCRLFLYCRQDSEYYFCVVLNPNLTLCLKFMCNTGWSGINSYICKTKRILVSLIPHQNIFQTACFYLNWHMNTQYNRNWSIGNPQLIYFVKVGVWWLWWGLWGLCFMHIQFNLRFCDSDTASGPVACTL